MQSSWPDSATILKRSHAVFLAQWEELLRLSRLALKTSDLDGIHDLRVTSRRFRAALELFYPFLLKGGRADLSRGVKTLTQALGALRNIDEAELFFAARAPTLMSVYSAFCTSLTKLRAKELQRVTKSLKTFDHRRLDRLVRKMGSGLNEDHVAARNSTSIQVYFSETAAGKRQSAQQLLTGVTAPGQRTSRHSLRIAIKKWRYFLEIVAPIMDREVTPFLELLKEYQSLLGRMNDVAEFEALLKKLKLTRSTRHAAGEILKAEDADLLEEFTALTRQKPLILYSPDLI